MAKSARQQRFGVHFEFLAVDVLRSDGHVLRPRHVTAKPRQRQTAFLFALLAFRINNLRIRAHDLQ